MYELGPFNIILYFSNGHKLGEEFLSFV